MEVCWGLGFVLLAWLCCEPLAHLDVTLVAGHDTDDAVERAPPPSIFSPEPWQRRRPSLSGDARRPWARLLLAELFTVSGCRARSCGSSFSRSSSRFTPRTPSGLLVDGLEELLFAIGFGFEVVATINSSASRPGKRTAAKVLAASLALHAASELFGDATTWWGLYAIAASTSSGWLTILSPSLMTLLLVRVSGVTLLEKGLTASKPGYREYIARTPAFFPWFPRGTP